MKINSHCLVKQINGTTTCIDPPGTVITQVQVCKSSRVSEQRFYSVVQIFTSLGGMLTLCGLFLDGFTQGGLWHFFDRLFRIWKKMSFHFRRGFSVVTICGLGSADSWTPLLGGSCLVAKLCHLDTNFEVLVPWLDSMAPESSFRLVDV